MSKETKFEQLKKQLDDQTANNRLSEEELNVIEQQLALEIQAIRQNIILVKKKVEHYDELSSFIHKLIEKQTALPLDAEELNLELAGSSNHLSEEKE